MSLIRLPLEPRPGEPPNSVIISQIIRALRNLSNQITTLTRPTSSGARSSTITPFTLSGLVEGTPGVLKITVSPGLVDNIVPTIDGEFLVSLPAPKLTLTGENGEIWLKNTLDARGVITESIVQSGDEMPEDDEDGDFAYRLVGTFTSTDGAFTSLVSLLTTNQNHRRCNGSSTWGN
jgi:hypothetical protein